MNHVYRISQYRQFFSQRFYLLKQLVSREMKLMYKRSLLGIAWTLISPLLQLAALVFVFQVVIPVDVPNYASFVFCGLLSWNWFQASLFQSTGVIITNSSLIRQPRFPASILPLVTVTVGLVHFLLALPVLLVFLIIDNINISVCLLFLPLLQLIQFLLTVSLGYLLAAVNVTFRDTQHTLGVILLFMFYLTPVFYSTEGVPENYLALYNLNPMATLIAAYRSIILDGVAPDWSTIYPVLLCLVILAPLSFIYFNYKANKFVEEL